jgi:hypothetical protein
MVDSEPGVTVQLEVDFQDDGVNEYEHPIPSTDWTTFSYHIRPPESFGSIRFRIRKTGAGDTTLAQIQADRDSASMCASQDPLEYDDLPLGATCTGNSASASATCGAQSEQRLCDAGGDPYQTDADCPGYDTQAGRCVTLDPCDGACLLDERPGVP